MSASLAPECNEVKERYDSCFLKWYSEKYLRGKGTTDECADLFKDYKQCLTSVLKKRGIDKMLEEAREDHKENDALNMRRKCGNGKYIILQHQEGVRGNVTALENNLGSVKMSLVLINKTVKYVTGYTFVGAE